MVGNGVVSAQDPALNPIPGRKRPQALATRRLRIESGTQVWAVNEEAPIAADAPQWLGLSLRLEGRRCLIVGGGKVALRRCRALLGSGAAITVVAPKIHSQIRASDIRCAQRAYQPDDLDDCDLVIVATNDAAVNQAVAAEARGRGLWINAAHRAADGNIIFPSTVRRGDLSISVATGGRAPALSQYLAAEIGSRYGPGWSRIVDSLARWRARATEALRTAGERRSFWHRLLGGAFAELHLGGQGEAAEARLEAELGRAAGSGAKPPGAVFLVGAGPGDQRLLTLRAFDLLQKADVVLYDRLVSAEILACVPGHVDLINVGKESQRPSLGQKPINELMVESARSGLDVVRLKGGDPFIFGRGGEEIAELARSGISFEVIPGITAANGCACYYGIPLTHRDYAHSCVLMTAHRRGDAGEIDWASLVRPMQTLVLYMGNYRLSEVARALKSNGCPGSHPVALISCGTTAREKSYIGSLDEVLECPPRLDSPALAIVGEVVRLSPRLNWRQRSLAATGQSPAGSAGPAPPAGDGP